MDQTIKRVAFIGLGIMGAPMAGHLANKGYEVTVYNRSRSKVEAWLKEYSGKAAETAGSAAADADAVVLCVGDDADLRAVMLGDFGVLSALQRGKLIIDHTTASAKVAREIGKLAENSEISFLDAPVSGGSVGAINAKLSIMVGGNEQDFNRALPLMQCYGANINLMGPVGSGQLTKMVNQICIAGTLQGVAEAMRFGLNTGLDMAKVLAVVSKGAAQSWQLENRGPWMLENKYPQGGFAVDLMKKDLNLCLGEALESTTSLPVTEQVFQFFEELHEQGKGRWDFSSLFDRLS